MKKNQVSGFRFSVFGKFKTWNHSRGFSLLFAALVASIVLSLGAAIFDIAIKQVELSSASRESQYAFYAADTAANCALYWDERCQYFATTTPSSCGTGGPALPPSCDGQTLVVTPVYTSASPATYPYTQTFNTSSSNFAPNGYCAQIHVTKSQTTGSGGVMTVQTVVRADGYNVPCSGLSGPTALQRTVQLNY